ncbi:MAG: dethiobiotin synthase, partial [Pyrinomonadaceae bacterium]
MLRGLFITGTDTGVGKTVISAVLMHRYRPAFLRYWKPIQTGIAIDDDTETVRLLGACSDRDIFNHGVRLKAPLAPMFAARHESLSINLDWFISLVHGEAEDARWIVEGAGGILVPITEAEMIIDLIVRLGLPALVVARTELGTINHTLLTIEELSRRKIEVAGVAMV